MSALFGGVLVEGVPGLLGALVGDFDGGVRLVCRERCFETFFLAGGGPVPGGAHGVSCLVEGVALASPVPQSDLLDTAAHPTWRVTGELDDMKRVERAGGVAGLVIDGVLVSLEGSQRRDLHPCTEVFAALLELILVYSARPSWDQVQQHGRGMVLHAGQIHDVGQLPGAAAVPDGGACHFFYACGLGIGEDPAGVGGGELGEGLFPSGGELALDEAGWCCSFAGGSPSGSPAGAVGANPSAMIRATEPAEGNPVPTGLLRRDSRPHRPNQRWVVDLRRCANPVEVLVAWCSPLRLVAPAVSSAELRVRGGGL